MTVPPAITSLRSALGSLPAVKDVSSGIQSLDGLGDADLALPGEFAQLPIGTLRRTHGGLPHEALVSFTFELDRTEAGWRTLEFLAWFFRDVARAGESVQLRPFALPPEGPHGPQTSLRFDVDLFWPNADRDLEPILARIQAIANHLRQSADLYALR